MTRTLTINVDRTKTLVEEQRTVSPVTGRTMTLTDASRTSTIVRPSRALSITRTTRTTTPVSPVRTISVVQGARGATGETGNSTETVTAGETISALKPIAIIDGEAVVASHSTSAHKGFLGGISITSATSGNNVNVRTAGQIQDDSWNWDVAIPWIFVGNGILTQTPPTSGWLQSVARVESADTIFVQLGEIIERV